MKHTTVCSGFLFSCFSCLCVLLPAYPVEAQVGSTEMAKWQGNKTAAVSLTFDDGSENQIRLAIPAMNRQDMQGTFFVNPSRMPGSEYLSRPARPVQEILDESARVPTNGKNLRERVSCLRLLKRFNYNDEENTIRQAMR